MGFWDSAAFLVQLNAILRGCLQPDPKTPEHPQDGSQTTPEGGPDAAKMREQEKTIVHMARVVAEQGVKIRVL
jgi:hypothetical protein